VTRRLYSAVVDPHRAFPAQAQTLVRSLIELAGVRSDDIVLHVVGPQTDWAVNAALERLGVDLVQISAYPGHPWCNKLQQLAPLLDRECDEVVLLDCDVIVMQEPPSAFGGVSAKIADFGNPSIAVFESLFDEAQVPLVRTKTDIDRAETAWANANGGLYVIDHRVLGPLTTAWRHWADWCIQRRARFGDMWMHIDQVAFSLAVASERVTFHPLERRFNMPTHVAQEASLDCVPAVLHYHQAVDTQRLLQPVSGLHVANESIAQVNRWLLSGRREYFDNTTFWNARYSQDPDLGSGVGSRGETRDYKANLLSAVVEILRVRSVVDIGGGDGQVMAAVTGDFSVSAADVATSSREHYLANVPRAAWGLRDVTLGPVDLEGDLLVCFDLLIHLSCVDEYHSTVRNLVADGRPLLVSGFEEEPVELGPMTFFHEPLSQTLTDHGLLIFPVGAYRGTSVQLVFTADYFEESGMSQRLLQYATLLADNPLLLVDALATSKRVLGLIPSRLAPCIAYPWIVQQLMGSRRLRVLDAGARVNVLPLMLANRGHQVFTTDPHRLMQVSAPRGHWNEPGFLDYAGVDHRITSWHLPYEQTGDELELDVLVIVSVIERLPASVRREWLAKASRQIVSGGLLLLTVATFPFSEDLWNSSEGIEIEDRHTHGNLISLSDEIRSSGFDLMAINHSTWLPASHVGMARIRAHRV
jgi:hypothetical protein